MTASRAVDVQRLEQERLTGSPADERNPPPVRQLLDEVISILYAAIREDQRNGKWGAR